ncbi:MAG TPA: hypothetical protein VN772_02785 [Solirubrobacteraceae bacterium]|nr:hypothetical protein [Solirubrobacteraceae bacterium]
MEDCGKATYVWPVEVPRFGGLMDEIPRCRRCGEIIGVYEPLVTLVEGRPWETSRLADPLAAALDGGAYHRACYEQAHGELERLD